MAQPPLVYVVDDDPDLRKSLGCLLTNAGYAVETFASGRDLLGDLCHDRPACAVVGLHMPDTGGLELQERLGAAAHPVPVVFVTGHADVATGVKAMKAGAVDFLAAPYCTEDLLDAVRRALDRDRQETEWRARVAGVARRLGTLTPRERAVFALVVTGRLNKQVAGELGISEKTVKVHRARVMDKMQADSLAALVRMAQDVGEPPRLANGSAHHDGSAAA